MRIYWLIVVALSVFIIIHGLNAKVLPICCRVNPCTFNKLIHLNFFIPYAIPACTGQVHPRQTASLRHVWYIHIDENIQSCELQESPHDLTCMPLNCGRKQTNKQKKTTKRKQILSTRCDFYSTHSTFYRCTRVTSP